MDIRRENSNYSLIIYRNADYGGFSSMNELHKSLSRISYSGLDLYECSILGQLVL